MAFTSISLSLVINKLILLLLTASSKPLAVRIVSLFSYIILNNVALLVETNELSLTLSIVNDKTKFLSKLLS